MTQKPNEDDPKEILAIGLCVIAAPLMIAIFIMMVKTSVCTAHFVTTDGASFTACMAAEIRKVEGGHTWSLNGDDP